MKRFCRVHYTQMVILLAVAVASALDASERSSIESTYELTKYLEYQLKEIKDVYLTYLGPPFNEKDFSPPRPNSTALSLPSAATRLELWHGLENQARLALNQKAYSILLAAVRELARSTLCPSLKTSLLHFCTGLDGLLGSISALMTTLGYALPATSANMRVMSSDMQRGRDRPAPLMSTGLYRSRTRAESGQRGSTRRTRTRVVRGDEEDALELTNTNSGAGRAEMPGGRSAGSKERGRRRGKRAEAERWSWDVEKDMQNTGGPKRKLLSLNEEQEFSISPPGIEIQTNINSNNNNAFSYNLNAPYGDTLRKEDGVFAETGLSVLVTNDEKSSSSSSRHHRSPRSLLPSTIPPPLSTLSLLYQFGEEHTLLPQPVPLSLRKGLYSPPQRSSPPSSSLSVRPTMNDFARKVEGFWILRELQSWLWRSAKDFNRLKKRL
ncbi:uncharacterized protein clcf1 [Periophthalmus magnuspinnatus]|uniref:uncharacterized protein clcf1 n=1 Tax=Periophthalmus magnuspinnatus TaxID=409849 RepID=UPI00145BEFC8|nr:uncharacterized protein clcf1 [Periophthalmus magnuspinnatus]